MTTEERAAHFAEWILSGEGPTTHEERVWWHEYKTLEGMAQHAERIASLEELCEELMGWICYQKLGGDLPVSEYVRLEERMSALGMEVK